MSAVEERLRMALHVKADEARFRPADAFVVEAKMVKVPPAPPRSRRVAVIASAAAVIIATGAVVVARSQLATKTAPATARSEAHAVPPTALLRDATIADAPTLAPADAP